MRARLIDGPAAGRVVDLPDEVLRTGLIRIPVRSTGGGFSVYVYSALRRWHPPLLAPETVWSIDPTRYYR